MIEAIVKSLKDGGKILICGNGGLAAESEHFAAELVGKFGQNVFLPCISLTSNTSLITALANDIGFENVFAHQVAVLGKRGDIFIGMTTSHSKNILLAYEDAQEKEMTAFLWDAAWIEGEIGNNIASVAEKQEFIIVALHKLAAGIKREYASHKSQ